MKTFLSYINRMEYSLNVKDSGDELRPTDMSYLGVWWMVTILNKASVEEWVWRIGEWGRSMKYKNKKV